MEKKVNSLSSKICYASGDIYGGGAFMIFSLLFMNFLVLVEGLPVVATAIIMFVGRAWDAVTDSIMGRITDITRSKFGRRRIYFLIGIIPVFLSFFMLFYSFGIQNVTAKIVYYTLAYMFFGTVISIVMVPYNTILSDMTTDYNERTSYTTIRMIFAGGAALICAVIPSIVIKTFGAQEIGVEQIQGYLVMGLIFGALFGISWFVVFIGTWEKKDIPKPEKIPLKEWLSVFSNKPYKSFLGIFLPFQMSTDLVLALIIFYIDIVVLQYKYFELVVGTLLVCSTLLVAVQGKIAEKKGKSFPLLIGIPMWMLSTLAFIWLSPGVSVIVLCVLAALIAVGTSAGQLSTWSMLADIYDIDEIRTGKRQEGLYSGMTSFLRKFSSGVAILLIGFGLQALGFDQNKYSILKAETVDFNPAQYAGSGVVMGIKWMFVLIPLVLLTLCLIFAIKNKITKQRFDAVLKGIDEFKARGNIDALTEQETADILIATGMEKGKLWGK